MLLGGLRVVVFGLQRFGGYEDSFLPEISHHLHPGLQVLYRQVFNLIKK